MAMKGALFNTNKESFFWVNLCYNPGLKATGGTVSGTLNFRFPARYLDWAMARIFQNWSKFGESVFHILTDIEIFGTLLVNLYFSISKLHIIFTGE